MAERIALEGFGQDGHSELDGIYSIRASDGGDLVDMPGAELQHPDWAPPAR